MKLEFLKTSKMPGEYIEKTQNKGSNVRLKNQDTKPCINLSVQK
jgi:hypothetical protein